MSRTVLALALLVALTAALQIAGALRMTDATGTTCSFCHN